MTHMCILTLHASCDGLLFVTTKPDDDLETITLKFDVPESRNLLWAKTLGAFKHVYAHHLNDYDWLGQCDHLGRHRLMSAGS